MAYVEDAREYKRVKEIIRERDRLRHEVAILWQQNSSLRRKNSWLWHKLHGKPFGWFMTKQEKEVYPDDAKSSI